MNHVASFTYVKNGVRKWVCSCGEEFNLYAERSDHIRRST